MKVIEKMHMARIEHRTLQSKEALEIKSQNVMARNRTEETRIKRKRSNDKIQKQHGQGSNQRVDGSRRSKLKSEIMQCQGFEQRRGSLQARSKIKSKTM